MDNKNKAYDPKEEALGVSHWVTTEGLPTDSAFDGTCEDPQNFRFQVMSFRPNQTSIDVTIEVIRDGASVWSHTYNLTNKKGNVFRSRFRRLVTDEYDDASSGFGAGTPEHDNDANLQTIKVKLGDKLKLTYEPVAGHVVTDEVSVGRPMAENYDGPDQKRFDIRELKLHIVVFKNAEGQSCVTPAQVQQDIDDANERLAQMGIRIKEPPTYTWGAAPGPIADDYYFWPHMVSGSSDHVDMNNDEQWALQFRDSDSSTIDVMYVQSIVDQMPETTPHGTPPRRCLGANSYPKYSNGGDSGWLVICAGVPSNGRLVGGGTGLAGGGKPNVLAHEFLHHLLKSGSRDVDIKTGQRNGRDPITALFHHPAMSSKDVRTTKRVAPYNDDPSESDTQTARESAAKALW